MHVLRFLVCSQFRMALFYPAGLGGWDCLALWHLESAGVGAAGNAGYRQHDEVSPLWAIFCSLAWAQAIHNEIICSLNTKSHMC